MIFLVLMQLSPAANDTYFVHDNTKDLFSKVMRDLLQNVGDGVSVSDVSFSDGKFIKHNNKCTRYCSDKESVK